MNTHRSAAQSLMPPAGSILLSIETGGRGNGSHNVKDELRSSGLVYVTDARPGILRIPAKTGFRYIGPDGRTIRDRAVLERIRSLVIPPMWRSVWICSFTNGYLQAVGRDAKGRKQYIYHPRYRAVREETKYQKMLLFGRLLPRIRKRATADLKSPGLGKPKVLAAVVSLLDMAQIRVGNEEYVRQNQSFGLTTMRNRHVRIEGSTIRFSFRGKSGKSHELELQHRQLAKIVKRCQELPGYELFEYVAEDGAVVSIDSGMVNEYLREISGEDITAKDFRTWHGTVGAAVYLGACEAATQPDIKQNLASAVKAVAERLGNRPATCRKYYIHPAVIESYTTGQLCEQMTIRTNSRNSAGLTPQEKCVLKLLERESRSLGAKLRETVQRKRLCPPRNTLRARPARSSASTSILRKAPKRADATASAQKKSQRAR
jgi:DNA topoisomerase I